MTLVRLTARPTPACSIGTSPRLVGHSGTSVTEVVYRHQIRPAIQTGATVMDQLLGRAAEYLVTQWSLTGPRDLARLTGNGSEWVGDTGFEPVTSSV